MDALFRNTTTKSERISTAKIATKLGVCRNTVYSDLEKTPEEFDE